MNYYKKAIEIIGVDNQEWKDICIGFAKKHPKSFVDTVNSLNDPWQIGARKLIAEGKKIHAIKYCRQETDMGLKEAKEAVEAL